MFTRNDFAVALAVLAFFVWGKGTSAEQPAAQPAQAASGEDGTKALAHRLWVVTEAVLEKHVSPPARQQMLLGALAPLAANKKDLTSSELSRRVSQVTTEEQFAALLRELLPAKGALEEHQKVALIDSMLNWVPGVARYIPAKELRPMVQFANNRYVGTGIQIGINRKEGLTQIMVPFPGGPARRAGAKPGDLIVAIDGKDMKGVGLPAVVDKLRGEDGTPVTVLVRQPESTETRTLNIVRAVATIESVVGFHRASEDAWDYRVEKGVPVVYLRLAHLTVSSQHELRKIARKFETEEVAGLILDLRGTGDGTMDAAAQVADSLLDGGVMWNVRDGNNHVREYKADRDCLFRDRPIVVLMDRNTSSQAQLIAAALKDNGRATLVGEEPRPGGWVASIVPLPGEQGGLNLATERAERVVAPGKSVRPEEEEPEDPRGWSLRPDQAVSVSGEQRQKIETWQREQLSPEPPAGAMTRPPEDPQLTRALTLLKEKVKK